MRPETSAPRRGKTKPSVTVDPTVTFSSHLTSIDDSALVQASKRGSVAAFEELAKRYQRKLLRVAQSLTRNHEDAQEVVQESLLKAFLKLDQFQNQAKFSTWLFRINVNEARMKMRKRVNANILIMESSGAASSEFPPETVDSAPNPEDLCYASELRQILLSASMKLRPRLRVVFVLRDVQGLSIDQTAKQLRLNESTVKSRLRRARIQLRDQLRPALGLAEEFINIGLRTDNAQSRRRQPDRFPS
jgi:RNA polymerase sigma-70 factor, ECF subfamily